MRAARNMLGSAVVVNLSWTESEDYTARRRQLIEQAKDEAVQQGRRFARIVDVRGVERDYVEVG